jgi:hypothetical protein
METLKQRLERKRYEWIAFKRKTNQKIYTRAVLNVERDTSTVQQSNFSAWIITTEKGIARAVLNKATNPPQIGSIIEFRVSPFKNSYDKFYISEIVREIPKAGEHYLFELWEIDELNKIRATWKTEQ